MSPCLSIMPGVNAPPDPEPVLGQLRQLPADQLEQLTAAWLARLHIDRLQRLDLPDAPGSVATYQGALHGLPLPLPIAVRIHRRRSRLQALHVDAFAGQLLRAGLSTGLLITTGSFSPSAVVAAASYRNLHLRLYTGPQWVAELIQQRLGVRRHRFTDWILAGVSLPSALRGRKGER